jgi:hypothetical protein
MEGIPATRRQIRDDLTLLIIVLSLCLLPAVAASAMLAEWLHDAQIYLLPTELLAMAGGIALCVRLRRAC